MRSAVLTAVLVTLAVIWRAVGTVPATVPTWFFLAFLWVAAASLTVTGYRGGQNVYRYGVGVATASAPRP